MVKRPKNIKFCLGCSNISVEVWQTVDWCGFVEDENLVWTCRKNAFPKDMRTVKACSMYKPITDKQKERFENRENRLYKEYGYGT